MCGFEVVGPAATFVGAVATDGAGATVVELFSASDFCCGFEQLATPKVTTKAMLKLVQNFGMTVLL
jgi:hypothetical protein